MKKNARKVDKKKQLRKRETIVQKCFIPETSETMSLKTLDNFRLQVKHGLRSIKIFHDLMSTSNHERSQLKNQKNTITTLTGISKILTETIVVIGAGTPHSHSRANDSNVRRNQSEATVAYDCQS